MSNLIKLLLFTSLVSFIISYDKPALVYALNEIQLKEIERIILEKFFIGKEISIPDFEKTEHFNFIGTVELKITECTFKFVDLTTDVIEIQFREKDQVNFILRNINGELNCKYVFKSNFYSNEGAAQITLSNGSLELSNKLTTVVNKEEPTKLGPSFEISKLELTSVEIDMKFEKEGQLEKILKYLITNLTDAIVELIQSKINSDMIKVVNAQIVEMTASLSLLIKIPDTSMIISYSLNEGPVISNEILTYAFNAEIYTDKDHYEGTPHFLPPIVDTESQIDLLLNQYIIENLLYILYKEDKLNFFINAEKIGKIKVELFDDIFPTMKNHYQRDQLVDFQLNAFDLPVINFIEKPQGKIVLVLKHNIAFKVRDEEGKSETAVAGNSNIELEIEFEVKEGKINAKILLMKFTQFETTETLIGKIDETIFINETETLISDLILPINAAINKFFNDLVLPSFMGIVFDQSNAVIHDKYIQIGLTPHLNTTVLSPFKIIEA